jgi:hypothetical protein
MEANASSGLVTLMPISVEGGTVEMFNYEQMSQRLSQHHHNHHNHHNNHNHHHQQQQHQQQVYAHEAYDRKPNILTLSDHGALVNNTNGEIKVEGRRSTKKGTISKMSIKKENSGSSRALAGKLAGLNKSDTFKRSKKGATVSKLSQSAAHVNMKAFASSSQEYDSFNSKFGSGSAEKCHASEGLDGDDIGDKNDMSMNSSNY